MSRPATEEEKQKAEEFQQKMGMFNKEHFDIMNKHMQNMMMELNQQFNIPNFPFENNKSSPELPQQDESTAESIKPELPCFCSKC